MKDKKIIEKIKEKFERIFNKKGPKPRDPEILNKIYEEIKKSNEPVKISELVEYTQIKEATIRRYIKEYLEPKVYVKKNRVYTPPFLMIITDEAENDPDIKPDFIYGKENRNNRIGEEKDLSKQKMNLLSSQDQVKLKILLREKEYKSKFIKEWNEIIEKLWIKKEFSVNKLKIASGANRYKI